MVSVTTFGVLGLFSVCVPKLKLVDDRDTRGLITRAVSSTRWVDALSVMVR